MGTSRCPFQNRTLKTKGTMTIIILFMGLVSYFYFLCISVSSYEKWYVRCLFLLWVLFIVESYLVNICKNSLSSKNYSIYFLRTCQLKDYSHIFWKPKIKGLNNDSLIHSIFISVMLSSLDRVVIHMLDILLVGYSSFLSPCVAFQPHHFGSPMRYKDAWMLGLGELTGIIIPWPWRRNLQMSMSICFYTAVLTHSPRACWGDSMFAVSLLRKLSGLLFLSC